MSEKKRLNFTKMQGAGNDYVYIDALGTPTSTDVSDLDLPDLARKISDRHFGVGSDGLIVIMPSDNADFRMRIFNADGSEAQMCGNGARCVACYLYEKKITNKTTVRLATKSGIKILHIREDGGHVKDVTVDMGEVILLRGGIPVAGNPDTMMIDEELIAGEKAFNVTAIGMGNPHGVIFVDTLSDETVEKYGPVLECHPSFPEKANIEFVEFVSPKKLKMRVWERGSGETLACGTGTCASVVAAYMKGLTETEVDVDLLGGTLSITYDSTTRHVFMRGDAKIIADGIYYYDEESDYREGCNNI